jgi:hypothetical protein
MLQSIDEASFILIAIRLFKITKSMLHSILPQSPVCSIFTLFHFTFSILFIQEPLSNIRAFLIAIRHSLATFQSVKPIAQISFTFRINELCISLQKGVICCVYLTILLLDVSGVELVTIRWVENRRLEVLNDSRF